MDSTYKKHKEIVRLYEPTQKKFPERPCSKEELEYLKEASMKPLMIISVDKSGIRSERKSKGLDGKTASEIYADVMMAMGAYDASTTRDDLLQEGMVYMTHMIYSFSKPNCEVHMGPKPSGAKTKPLEHYFKYYFKSRCRTVAVNALDKSKKNSVDDNGDEFDGENIFTTKHDDSIPTFLGMSQKEMEITLSTLRKKLSGRLAKYRTADGTRVKSKLECLFDDVYAGMTEREMVEKYKNTEIWHPADKYRNSKYISLKAQLNYEMAIFVRKHAVSADKVANEGEEYE